MVTSDALENERIPEERRMKYYLNLFYDKKYLYEIKIMQTKNFFMKRIEQHMDKVYKKKARNQSAHAEVLWDFLPVSEPLDDLDFCLYRLTGVSGRAVGRRIFGMREDD